MKDGVAKQLNKIPEADKLPHPPDHAVRQGEPDSEKKGVSHEGDQEDRPRQHKNDAEIPLPVKEVPQGKGF